MLEQETDNLLQQYKTVEKSYGMDILTLGVCCRYIEWLLSDVQVQRYTSKRYPDILQQLQQVLAEVQEDRLKRAKMPVKKAPTAEKSASLPAPKRRAAAG
jgi:hypothetical protein